MTLVYSFKDRFDDKLQLGNKGGNLVVMYNLGLPVPPGFVVSIDAYKNWQTNGVLPETEIRQALASLEDDMGRQLGKGLQVSVRSSAPVSMPGMMDTVLNINEYGNMLLKIRQIFESWDNLRAIEYRRLNNIPTNLGTAAVVQAMVFGNRDDKSGTGVVFSRNPSTGEKGLFGEYLAQAQGEAIVSGVQTPEPIQSLKNAMPEIYDELDEIARKLENHFFDMQDIEFTIESGKLYILQTRAGKRSSSAVVKIIVDMVAEKIITREEGISRISVNDIRGLIHKRLKQTTHTPFTKGLNAAPGAAAGKIVFDSPNALALNKKGQSIILVRPETNPDDIQGIAAADGVLTQRGGLTSHAAIVTRGMGKPCVTGTEGINIDPDKRQLTAGKLVLKEGDEITIDGTTGEVYVGILPLEEVSITPELEELMSWANGFKRLGVRANADTPEMINQAITFGAEGIGLCRTERMFNAPERLSEIRDFILADNAAGRAEAITRLKALQTNDFIALFKTLNGLPIIIRLLDLPLHEFLPHEDTVKDIRVKQRIQELKETNPMLGHRGVRLAVTLPEIYSMQIEAIEEARQQVPANVSIMIPQVITSQEVLNIKKLLKGSTMRLGVMMETVRACMRASRLAEEVDFFSFGTNDLTQAVLSFSREDAEKKFLSTYLELGILKNNPFEVLDVNGVGQLMDTAIFWARRAKKDIEIGVCGEQAGEPQTIHFLHSLGIDYVSCTPYRIPIARIVAAQAALESRESPAKRDNQKKEEKQGKK
ncbi:MAG: pyruvate, phosphate dikinase [Dehalococcoidales bacterium]|nr:pyruvate, phosphate dikinase [Dehalococcoidales bacterium]